MSTKTAKPVLDTHNTITTEDLYDLLSIQLDELDANPDCVRNMRPMMIWGAPGCGKSSIVRKVCEDRGIEFLDRRLCQMESVDVRGLPVPNREDKCMDWYVNGGWPRDKNGKGIIFLDELSAADRSIQAAAYELILDRKLGEMYQVPPGYLIVAAGNKSDDHAIAMTMSSALANRFMHVELRENAESWVNWAQVAGVHPAVTGFISYKPSLLFNMTGENLERGWPSPRSWDGVSQACHMFNGKKERLLRKMVYGLVGNGAGVEFMEFYKLNAEFSNILDVMTDPNRKIEIPERADRKYAMCSAMTYMLWRGKDKKDEAARIDGFYRICIELTSDFASMSLNAAMQGANAAEKKYRADALFRHPMFSKWAKKHGAALKKYVDISKMF